MSAAPTTFQFDEHTSVQPCGDGAFTASLSEHWCARPGAPNGGYTLAVCLQALRQAVARSAAPDPLVVSATYLRPAAVGAAQIRTQQLRVGRRLTTGEAGLFQGGTQVMAVRATFADLANAQGATRMANGAPGLPPPAQCIAQPPVASMHGATMAQRMEYRWPRLPGWLTGSPGGASSAEFWMRFRDGRPADAYSLPLLVDAAAPVVFDLCECDSATIDLSVHVRAAPQSVWLACRAVTRHVIGGYHEEDFEIWDAHGTLLAQSRQLAVLTEAHRYESQAGR